MTTKIEPFEKTFQIVFHGYYYLFIYLEYHIQ